MARQQQRQAERRRRRRSQGRPAKVTLCCIGPSPHNNLPAPSELFTPHTQTQSGSEETRLQHTQARTHTLISSFVCFPVRAPNVPSGRGWTCSAGQDASTPSETRRLITQWEGPFLRSTLCSRKGHPDLGLQSLCVLKTGSPSFGLFTTPGSDCPA